MAINFLGLPQHFENTEQLREAERQGLLSEREYKITSGYDASQNVWGLGDLMGPVKPYSNLAASTLYNVDKSIRNPMDYFEETGNPKVGPMESIDYNVRGALEGLSPELQEKYEGILGLDRRSLTDTWAPGDLTDFSGVYNDEDEYDFSGIEGQTAALLGLPQLLGMAKAGMSKKQIMKKVLANQLKEAAAKKIGKKVKPIITGVLTGGGAKAGAPGAGQRREGKGGTHMSRSVSQGGLGISAAQAQSVSDANAAAGMSGWGLARGGRVSYFDGGLASLWLR